MTDLFFEIARSSKLKPHGTTARFGLELLVQATTSRLADGRRSSNLKRSIAGLLLGLAATGIPGCGSKTESPPPIPEETTTATLPADLERSIEELKQSSVAKAAIDPAAVQIAIDEQQQNQLLTAKPQGIPLVESDQPVLPLDPPSTPFSAASVRLDSAIDQSTPDQIEVDPGVLEASVVEPAVAAVEQVQPAIETLDPEVPATPEAAETLVDAVAAAAEIDPPSAETVDSEATAVEPAIPPKWDSPYAVLFITGQQHGYIEPCGCTGLENQKGGLMRRRSLLEQIKATGWEVIPIDAGNQVRRTGRQPEAKLQTTTDALKLMDYKAVAIGSDDLKLSSNFLLAMTASDATIRSPYVSANVAVFAPDTMTPWNIIESDGHKIGITSVLSDGYLKDVKNDEIITLPAAEGAQKALAAMQAAGCEMCVLIAHGTLDESKDLARSVPGYQVVVTAGGLGEPTYRPEPIEGSDSQLIQVGVKGMFVGLLGLFADAKNPIRYQRVPLTDRFEDDPKVVELFRNYQKQLQDLGLPGLGLKPVAHPSGNTFVGTESCAECHTTAYDIWKDTPHALATESIVHPPERSSIARHFDPECLSCHTTGWNPQEFFPFQGGFLALEGTPKLVANGCENCHGPGSAHVAAEKSKDASTNAEVLAKLRESMRLPLASAKEKCLECHDIDNSPDFHEDGAFEEYWSQVEHYGKD